MRLLFVTAVILILSCGREKSPKSSGMPAKQPDTTQPDTANADGNGTDNTAIEITCEGIGPVNLRDDMTALEQKAGKENMVLEQVEKEGVADGYVTRLWPDTQDEISVYWAERSAPFKTIKLLEISHPATPYRFNNGITVGSGLQEIVKLNGGKALKLYGFGWDYGGTFAGFNSGQLAADMPCFGGVFAIPEGAAIPGSAITGDRLITSDTEPLNDFEVKLSTLRILGKTASSVQAD